MVVPAFGRSVTAEQEKSDREAHEKSGGCGNERFLHVGDNPIWKQKGVQ